MNSTNKLTSFVTLVCNLSSVVIASSVLAELYLKFRDSRRKAAPVNIPDDDGDNDPSPATPLTNAA